MSDRTQMPDRYDEDISREPAGYLCRACGCESGKPGCTGTSVTCTNPYCPCSEDEPLKHGAEPLYQSADYCGHGDPPPESEARQRRTIRYHARRKRARRGGETR